MALEQTNVANQILWTLPPAKFAELQPHFSFVELPIRQRLELPNCVIKHVYFLESGLASLVVSSGAEQSIEIGIIGSDGMTGLPIMQKVLFDLYEDGQLSKDEKGQEYDDLADAGREAESSLHEMTAEDVRTSDR